MLTLLAAKSNKPYSYSYKNKCAFQCESNADFFLRIILEAPDLFCYKLMPKPSKIFSIFFSFLIVVFLSCGDFYAHADQGIDASIRDAVVKIFVTSNAMDYYRPWQSKGIAGSGGSGAIIEGNRILTNAHVVSDQTFIQVKKDANPKKYTAKLIAIGYDCDLALLEVDDPEFFEGVIPLRLGTLPKLQDNVAVIGYPQGGGKISITEGVVSRVELTSYAQSARELLAVQIDAAINPGNSGGPVMQDGKLVGIAMQILQASQNIGYMIPIPIIEHFLKDLEDKEYGGFPIIGINIQRMESPTLREYYGVPKGKGGVLVVGVLPFSPASNHLKENDVILAVNGVDIGEDGTFLFREDERLNFIHLLAKKYIGEKVDLKIVRDHKLEEIQFEMTPFVRLVPRTHHFSKPPYYIYGGLVFTVLSQDLLYAWGGQWGEKAPLDFVYHALGTGKFNDDKLEDLVVLLDILPDDINVGYPGSAKSIMKYINGQPVKSFKDFVLLMNQLKDKEDYAIFEFRNGWRVIVNNENIELINEQILKRNNIPEPYSEDVGQWLREDN